MRPVICTVRPAPEYPQNWIQFALVFNERVIWIEARPAIIAGWLFHRAWVQAGEAWQGMDVAQIVRFKRAAGPFDPATPRESQIALKWVSKYGIALPVAVR